MVELTKKANEQHEKERLEAMTPKEREESEDVTKQISKFVSH